MVNIPPTLMTPLPTPATPSPTKIADGSGDTVAGYISVEEPFQLDDLEIDEVDDFEVDEEYAFQIPNNDVKGLEAPLIGMTFETIEEARKYYEEYGRQKGFWIRTRTSCKGRNRSNEVSSMLLVCPKEGKHVAKTNNDGVIEGNDVRDQDEKVIPKKRVRSCSTIRCGCEAHLRITRGKWSAKWKVTVFSDIHNHQLVTPAKRMKMKSNRHMPKAVKDLTEAFHRENLEISKVPSIFGGEHIGFDNRDCYNHLRNVRHRDLDGGDAQSVLNYFRNKEAQNPQFFYAIQCDESGRAVNFFWVDSRSRIAYHYFRDVVTFDTTYRTNKYDMPFAPFTGVNHHMQSIQFGCALLQDETEVTFVWLFETWLEAMGGRSPTSIITDQDLAMKGAIAKVFPNTRHRLCIWHIKKKIVEKLSQVYYKKSKFKKEVNKCIWLTYKKVDFENRWMVLMKENGLESNEWLQHLYDIRDSWVPVYNCGTFFASMNTTRRSEGVNSFFDDFVTSTTNLKEFVVKYEQALKKIVKRENDEDYESEHKFRIVGDNEFLLKHAAKVYTRNLFNKFKDERSEVALYKVEDVGNANGFQSFIVKPKEYDIKKFTMTLDLQTFEGKCECQKFEFVGILCAHILKVFVRQDINTIPDHFILPRWRQKANKFRIIDSKGLVHDDGKEESEALRLSHMCQESTKLACLAAPSNEAYTIYIEAMNDLSTKLLKVSSYVPPIHVCDEKNDLNSTEPSQILLSDPNISQTKGRKKDVKGKDTSIHSGRLKSGIELALNKKKRKCNLCEKFGHDKRTCPKNPTSKTNKALQVEAQYSDSDEEKT